MNRRRDHDVYAEYYLNQAGSGFGNIYAGPSYQRGYGVGSFLGGLFRTVYPLLKKGTIALGSELLKTGASCITDMSRNEEPQVVFKKRGKEIVQNLSRRAADQMFGDGYKNPIVGVKRRQSTKATKGVKKRKTSGKTVKKTNKKRVKKSKAKTKKQRCKSDLLDIFS